MQFGCSRPKTSDVEFFILLMSIAKFNARRLPMAVLGLHNSSTVNNEDFNNFVSEVCFYRPTV